MYLIEFYGLSFIAETIEDLYSYRNEYNQHGRFHFLYYRSHLC